MLGFGAASAEAKDVPRLTALTACHGTDACIEMKMHWDFARTDRPNFVGKSDGARVVAVRGRLGKGRVRAYELVVGAADAKQEDFLGEVAYLGRSRDGRPMIVTDKGALALETRGMHVGRSEAIAIIDERTRDVVQSYLGGLGGGVYLVRGPRDTVVLSKSGACVSPPLSRPGALQSANGCKGDASVSKSLAFSERLAGNIKPAPDADLALIRKLLPQAVDLSDDELRARTGRLSPHHLVVTPWKAP
jgi:hypothetical protein